VATLLRFVLLRAWVFRVGHIAQRGARISPQPVEGPAL
jgi:hypothetical protein